MSSTVGALLRSAGLAWGGSVPWGVPVPEHETGVYLVSLAADPDGLGPTREVAPVSRSAVRELLECRPELTVDGSRPTEAVVADRLAAFWLADESVLYIGLAGRSTLGGRVNAYYTTPLGARSPHAGGWFLKTLEPEVPKFVHWAVSRDVEESELGLLRSFTASVSDRSRRLVGDPALPLPFANLERARGERKRHGIRGAREPQVREPRTKTATSPVAATAATVQTSGRGSDGSGRSQRVTEVDRRAGRIRFPKDAKRLFPVGPDTVNVILRGQTILCRWNPRTGMDKSGVLGVGSQRLSALVADDEVLTVRVDDEGRIALT